MAMAGLGLTMFWTFSVDNDCHELTDLELSYLHVMLDYKQQWHLGAAPRE
jgi:hypothetical protein